jgi:hypothetical protein
VYMRQNISSAKIYIIWSFFDMVYI